MKINLNQRVRDQLIKFGTSVKKSNSTSIVMLRIPESEQIGMILTGQPDNVVQLLYEAMNQNKDIRAVIYSAVSFDQKKLKEQAEKEKPKSKLILQSNI